MHVRHRGVVDESGFRNEDGDDFLPFKSEGALPSHLHHREKAVSLQLRPEFPADLGLQELED
eukprot:4823122-Alexandrium_andersonii.AAC.1